MKFAKNGLTLDFGHTSQHRIMIDERTHNLAYKKSFWHGNHK